MDRELDRLLRELGASDLDIAQARAEGWLPLLALDRAVMPGEATLDLPGIARSAGVDEERARGVWRALGFPDVPAGIALFTDADAEVLAKLDARGDFDGRLHEQVRVVSGALAKIAALEADEVALRLDALRDQGLDGDAIAQAVIEQFDWPTLAVLVDYTHRIQLRAALWRRLARTGSGPELDAAIGFADMVGYTALSLELDTEALSELLSRFENHVHDVVARHGGRVVKSIGDEVMYIGPPDQCLAIALDLADGEFGVPLLRQGLSYGSVLSRDGDFFGPVVNLASRLTELARPGTVLIAPALRKEVGEPEAVEFRRMRVRKVKGIGELAPYVVRRCQLLADDDGGRPPRSAASEHETSETRNS